MPETEMKQCSTANCPNEILADSQFPMCEPCRIIKMRADIALGQSPDQFSAPLALRKDRFQQTVSNMRQDEMVAWLSNIEWTYLELQKVIKLYGIGNEKKKAFKSLSEQVEEARFDADNDPNSKKAKRLRKACDKRKNTNQKAAKALGVDEKTAEAWMNEDIDL